MDKEDLRMGIERLYAQNLGVKPGETVLAFTDQVGPEENVPQDQLEKRRDLLELFRLIVGMAPVGVNVKEVIFDATGGHGKEPPEALWIAAFGLEVVDRLKKEDLWNRLLSKSLDQVEVDRVKQILLDFSSEDTEVVIGMSYYSSTHTRFRQLLTELFQVRYVSMPLFDHEMFSVTVSADWKKIADRTKKIASLFRPAEKVIIDAPNGTNLRVGIKDIPIHEDTGLLTEPGSFGNLPAGEVFMPPEPGATNGKLVLEFAPTWRLEKPVTLIIEKGEVVRVSGDDPYALELESFLERDKNYKNIAELGIGTNDKATRPDNILESEKILGTIHIALGDNSSFGGRIRTSFHQDFVVFHPTLTLLYPGDKRKEFLVRGQLKDVYKD
jgi:leucyl aminopeptidase (aminopeptidase T)